MKRTFHYPQSIGTVRLKTQSGEEYLIPVFPGILKHPDAQSLINLLNNYSVIHKYTCEALKHAAWPLLKQFPVLWLETCLNDVTLPPGRHRAIKFLLSIKTGSINPDNK